MSLSPAELQFAAFVMATAYAVMAIEGFGPAWRQGKRRSGAVVGARKVPAPVEVLWVGAQGVTVAALFLGFFFPRFAAEILLSLSPESSLPVAICGAALFAAGAALVAVAARHLGAELAVAIETRDGGRLVTTGPYARVRHPIYSGVFLMLGGLAVALASPLLAAYLPVAAYCANYRAKLEEDLLAKDARFADAYARYLASTGRFVPRGRPK